MDVERNPDDFLDEQDEDDHTEVHETKAFEREYLDERSWENLQEDEHGRLIAAPKRQASRKRFRAAEVAPSVKRGLIRYLQLVIDMSETCAQSTDMRPNRSVALVTLAKEFVSEFFDQNPISQMSISVMRHERCHRLSELAAAPEHHRKKLEGVETGGSVSLQNVLEQVSQAAALVPPYGYRECLILLSSLTTCDLGAIADAVKLAQKAQLHVTVIGLSAEMYISKKISEDTGGTYHVALSEAHLHALVMQQCSPPPASTTSVTPNLVRMAFPTKDPEGAGNATFVGETCLVVGGAYTCPKCLAKNVEIPCECQVCGITLIASPHLARSYHHLFPVPEFKELNLVEHSLLSEQCSACCMPFAPASDRVEVASDDQSFAYQCPTCSSLYCVRCDTFIHEHLHNCPGCEIINSS